MDICKTCGGTDFYKETGYFFCKTCQTQNDDIREEVFEVRVDNATRLRKTRIRQLKSNRPGGQSGWTSWELYNLVLIGLTNEIIGLGAPSNIKLTVLQLWATYLGKLEVAFVSTKSKTLPKLPRRYKKKDAEVIYGEIESQSSKKRKRARSSPNTSVISGGQSECNSSVRELNRSKKLLATADYERYVQSQASSDGDHLSTYSQIAPSQASSVKSSAKERKIQFSSHAKAEAKKVKELSKRVSRSKKAKYRETHVRTQYKIGPEIITPMRLWAIIYLGLRTHNHPIQLGDMLRYGKEGHLSYYKLDHLIPPEVELTASEKNLLTQNNEITHRGLRKMVSKMAKFIGVWELVCPDLSDLVARYCIELGLPSGIQLYAKRLIASSPPEMTFNAKKANVPNYEGRAMGFIIVVLKTLLGLDGVTEYQISRIADRINSTIRKQKLSDTELFSFREWQKYIECRKSILTRVHYPTRVKYSSESSVANNVYLEFMKYIHSKSNEEVRAWKFHDAITQRDTNDEPPLMVDVFPPSLTPHRSYFDCLNSLDDPSYDIPDTMRNYFHNKKVGYMTKDDFLTQLATKCDLKLEIIDSNAHFVEKYVPPFEQPRMPSIAELKGIVKVEGDSNSKDDTEKESLNNYLHSKIPCNIKLDVDKKQYYDSIESTIKAFDDSRPETMDCFTEILPNGKLLIPSDSDSEDEQNSEEKNLNAEKILLQDEFCDKYRIQLSLPEKESITNPANNMVRRKEFEFERNVKGQFVGIRKTAERDDAEIEEATKEYVPIVYDDSKEPIDDFFEHLVLNPSFSQESVNGGHKFFRPYKEYWMYECTFSRVKGKNFEVFERSLPASFRWLLNECALTLEMTAEDLYEEVCLIESYHSHILSPPNCSTHPIPKKLWYHIKNK